MCCRGTDSPCKCSPWVLYLVSYTRAIRRLLLPGPCSSWTILSCAHGYAQGSHRCCWSALFAWMQGQENQCMLLMCTLCLNAGARTTIANAAYGFLHPWTQKGNMAVRLKKLHESAQQRYEKFKDWLVKAVAEQATGMVAAVRLGLHHTKMGVYIHMGFAANNMGPEATTWGWHQTTWGLHQTTLGLQHKHDTGITPPQQREACTVQYEACFTCFTIKVYPSRLHH